MVDLSAFRAVLLDLDGTVYHDEHALPGAVELLKQLAARGQAFACLSNSTTSPMRIAERLARLGIDLDPTRIYTAAAAAADVVLQRFGQTRRPRLFNLATQGLQEMLHGAVDWVNTPGEPCDAVIVGTPANAYAADERQRLALALLRKGAALIGTSSDRVYPSLRGIEFGAGALTMMLAYAGQATPTFCGKPNAIFFDELCKRLNTSPNDCLLIGDNLEADITGGKAVGMKTALVLTGVTRRRDLLGLKPEHQPDYILDELTGLLD